MRQLGDICNLYVGCALSTTVQEYCCRIVQLSFIHEGQNAQIPLDITLSNKVPTTVGLSIMLSLLEGQG